MSEQQESFSPSKFSKHYSEVHLYERIRLHSFQSLLNGSPGLARLPGKHPRVLLEDLLKAEVLSSQLVLGIEDLVKSLRGMLDTGQANGEDYAMSSATEDESIKSFRSALMQSANTLDELTKLQITEHRKDAVKNVATTECDTHALFVNTASIGEHAAEDDIADQRPGKLLFYASESTTSGEKSSSFSARPSEFGSTSPSDATACEENDESGNTPEETRKDRDLTLLHEAVDNLRSEIVELQTKHEVHFFTFARELIDLEQDESPTMRKIMEKILCKLSPQDQNWTFHSRFDEAEMEQLFYFVLLQKTLKSCLAVMNDPPLREFNRKTEHERTQLCKTKDVPGQNGQIPLLSNANTLCTSCRRPLRADRNFAEKSKAEYQTHSTMLHAPGKSDIQQYNSSDSNEEPIHLNGLKKSSLKRPHEFEGEQQNKKQKKGKSLFSCFSAKWMRNKKRSKKH